MAETGQFPHVVIGASRMGGHEIVGQELSLPPLPVEGVETFLELDQPVDGGFPHKSQDPVGGMLRCNLHLSGHMMGYDPPEVVVPVSLVGEYHVVPYTGVDEDPPHTGHGGYPPQKGDLTGMVDGHPGTGFRTEASAVPTDPIRYFLRTFDAVHVGCGAAHILDYAVETGR